MSSPPPKNDTLQRLRVTASRRFEDGLLLDALLETRAGACSRRPKVWLVELSGERRVA
jgi:hypothetical protein